MRRQKHRVSGNAIALLEKHDVIHDYVAAGNDLRLAVAHDAHTRAGQVAQRLEHALRLALLDDRDAEDYPHEREQQQRFTGVAQDQVEQARGNDHQEHRLAEHAERDAQNVRRPCAGNSLRPAAASRAAASRRVRPRSAPASGAVAAAFRLCGMVKSSGSNYAMCGRGTL